jgi:hypothetical protein
MAKFARPAKDFWVTDLKSDLGIVAAHTEAGFDPISDAVVRLRLFILYDFLWSKGLLTERLVEDPDEVRPDTALWNRHLTDEGYYFLQKYLPCWQGRLYKHTSEDKERSYLQRWHAQFAEAQSA